MKKSTQKKSGFKGAMLNGAEGRDIRLTACQEMKGIEFSDKWSYNKALQATLGKVIAGDRNNIPKMTALGAISEGLYTGKATVVLKDNADKNDRRSYCVKFLGKVDNIDWSTVPSVGCLR